MKIAMMVRGYLPVPRPADVIYAPIDLAITIAEGLAKRGHTVDFFAPDGSKLTGARVETMGLRPLALSEAEFRDIVNDPGLRGHMQPALWDGYMGDEMFKRAARGEYDLLHFHHAEVALPFVRDNPKTPVVYTIHDPLNTWYKEIFELYTSPNQHFVSISNNQRRGAPDLAYAQTVYNGVDTDFFPFSADSDDYLLIAGRIFPEKGFKEAIELAQETDSRLLMIGPVYPEQQGYFNQYIKPHLNDKILYLGAMEQDQLIRYYQKAKAFVAPIQWEEPFGLTIVEAMACGTPVISLHRGAAPELIINGKTGFVCHSMAEMAEAVRRVGDICRATCRLHVEQNFSNTIMVDNYEKVFTRLIAESKPKRIVSKPVRIASKVPRPLNRPTKTTRASRTGNAAVGIK